VNANQRNAEIQIGILGTANSWHVQDLLDAAKRLGHPAQVISFDALAATMRDARHTASVHGFDALLVRSMPRGTLEQIIFRMDVLGELCRRGSVVVNPPRALEIAIDKYLGLSRLQAAGLTIPETTVCQTMDDAMAAFAALGGDVVLKPLFGSEGRGLVHVCDRSAARQAIESLLASQGVVYLQRFVPHAGFDYRLFVVGDRLLGMRRSNCSDWKLNVKQGATVEPIEVEPVLAAVARRAAAAVGASLAGVDVLPSRGGKVYTLEVNAVPGWRALQLATGEDVAALVIEHCRQLGRKQARPGT
jgi:ribosomal protein S6--L-glutamate ligase